MEEVGGIRFVNPGKMLVSWYVFLWLGLGSVIISLGKLMPLVENPHSDADAVGLSEIVEGLGVPTIAVVLLHKKFRPVYEQFLRMIPGLSICFHDPQKFLDWVESHSFSTHSLIFGKPKDLIEEIVDRKLDHRMNLFMFYWNSTRFSKSLVYPEPLRVVLLTVPREKVIRVYYNQATPDGEGYLSLVNWYDGNSLGLFRTPLLPSAKEVYRDFQERLILIPVLHSPPWLFVSYHNNSQPDFNDTLSMSENATEEETGFISVTGGRDDNLIKLLAMKLNFKYEYIDIPDRVQGSPYASKDNLSFSGGIGMLQRRQAHLFLGDVAVTLERSEAVEFSFFTLADSGAFVTHIPERLNEALALIRPFHYSVWPPLVLTILLSGPILFLLVYLPHRFMPKRDTEEVVHFPIQYISEMRYGLRENHHLLCRPQRDENELPENFFSKCVWFSYNLFLKQNCRFPFDKGLGVRVKLIVATYWICATYILSDVYSAQLTSQLARPAREAAIDTLHKLEMAIKLQNYELYVEKQSASLSILENGTDNEIFHRLYKLMMLQHRNEDNSSYLIDSVEQGIEMVSHPGSRKVVLGGRETLYFNMRRYGVKHFQMSEKLYTRYSAVAVPSGLFFLERLNNVLIRLFESGVLDRMTNEEYDKMFQISKKSFAESQKSTKDAPQTTAEEVILKKLNLRTLKGAFIVLLLGFALSSVIFILEQFRFDSDAIGMGLSRSWSCMKITIRVFGRFLYNRLILKVIRLIMFKYRWD